MEPYSGSSLASFEIETLLRLQAVIVGGGYIGMEISASLANNGVKATIVFPEPFLLARCFP